MNYLQRDIMQCPRVAVYGTLKRGYPNHHWLHDATLLGQDHLIDITLYNLDAYPGAKLETSSGCIVEIYAISANQLARLDTLEGYMPMAPKVGLYDRMVLSTRYGDAWCYLYNAKVAPEARLTSGEWLSAY